MIRYIFFDLDGTLTDSSEGITKCARLTLEHFGIEGYEYEDLLCFIGPPLRETFPKFGIRTEDVDEAIEIFRRRYKRVGKFENKPYQGIPELLDDLKKHGHKLYVATSKPEVTAKEILEKFDLTQYFELVCGASMDLTRETKEAVIGYLIDNIRKESSEALSGKDILDNVIMVGDTKFDVIGAKEFGIRTIGVDWGFGSIEEMTKAGATAIVHNMDELKKYVE